MKIAAQDFGNSGIVRNICDRCHAPITPTTLLWRGRKGDYCSRECRREAEEKDDMTQAAEAIDEFEEVLKPEVLDPEESSTIAAAPAKAKKGKAKGKKTVAKAAKKAVAIDEFEEVLKPEVLEPEESSPIAATPAKPKKGKAKGKKAVTKAAPAAKKTAKPAKAANGTRGKYPLDAKIHLVGDIDYGGKEGKLFGLMKEGMTVEKYRKLAEKIDSTFATKGLRDALRAGAVEIT
jgi:hypothetical protein